MTKHKLTRTNGEPGHIQSSCSCGWQGKQHSNDDEFQATNIANEEDGHIADWLIAEVQKDDD